jgi:hypothetical protein
MKKLFVLLLAFAVTAGAFAQAPAPALAWSGYVNTGIEYNSGTELLTLHNADTGNQTRVRLAAAYTNGDFGVNFRLQSSDFTAPSLNRAFAWGKFLGGMVKVQVGKVDGGPWTTAYNGNGSWDGKTGTILQVMPMAGLNAGIFLPLTNTGATLTDSFKDLAIGFKYTLEGLATIAGTFDLGATANALIWPMLNSP